MSQAITTLNADGKSVFSSSISPEQKSFPIPLGNMTILYSTREFPANIKSEGDITSYVHDREHGFGPGVACPPGGTSATIIQLAPGLASPMRGLPTLGIFYVLEGRVRLQLDGGESKVFGVGDAGVLRGAVHSWTNETPDDGWAKLLSFAQSIEQQAN